MPSLAETLRQVGYVTPQGVTGPNAPLAQQLKNYATNVIPTARQNLAQQRADIDAALTMGQGGIQIGDREAFERQIAEIPNLGGVMKVSGAMQTAQRNAALPVEQGGLGLAPENTALERAKALGFKTENPVYHGTGANIEKFDLRGKSRKGGKAYFVTESPITASYYAGNVNERFPSHNPNVMKLYINPKNTFDYANTEHLDKISKEINKLSEGELIRYGYYYPPQNWIERISTGDWATIENPAIIKAMKKAGFDSAKLVEGNQPNIMMLNNKNLRSVNAAFDPMNVNKPDLLAGALAVPLATDEDTRRTLLEKLFNEKQK